MNNFIPKQPKSEPFSIRIDKKKMAELQKLATSYHLSCSAFINQCIDFALAHLSTPKE